MLYMRYKRKKIVSLLLLGLCLTGLQAQEAIPASGGNGSGSGGSVSYTVGQIVYITNTGTNSYIAEGVQQPFEISVISGIEHGKEITLQFMVYPNPTTDLLILKTDSDILTQCIASLYNVNGKLLENIKLTSNETIIEMSNLVPGNYFLRIIKGNKEIKTFKIIKINKL